MNKRVTAFLCALALLVGLLPAGTAAAASEEATTQQYLVGYAKRDINPWVQVDPDTKEIVTNEGKAVFVDPDNATNKELYTDLFTLTGNDDDERRTLSGLFDDNGDNVQGKGDGIFTTATAITDYKGKTVIFITIDALQGYDHITDDARSKIVDALGSDVISENQIMVSASHTHSSAHYLNLQAGADKVLKDDGKGGKEGDRRKYYDHVIDQITDAAVTAYNDHALATMSKGTVDAKEATKSLGYNKDENDVAQGYHMNAVRHYEVETTGENYKYIIGSTANKSPGDKTYTPVEESDNDMHVLLFKFEDEDQKPVVFVNWRAHTTMNSGVKKKTLSNGLVVDGYTQLSSDYVNGLRTTLENDGYRAAFFQGAAGNVVTAAREEVWSNGTYQYSYKDDNDITQYINYSYTALHDNEIYKDWLNQVDKEEAQDDREARKTFIYGRMLAEIAEYCIKNKMEDMGAGAIRTDHETWGGDPQMFSDGLYQAALNATSYPFSYYYEGEPYIVNSSAHKNMIIRRHDNASGYTETDLELNVILLGDQVAFVTAPNELADKYHNYDKSGNTPEMTQGVISATVNNDWNNLIDNDTYGTPFVLGYSNGRRGYIGNWLDHITNSQEYTTKTGFAAGAESIYGPGTYESNTSRLAKGEGERLIKTYGDMLNELLPQPTKDTSAILYGPAGEWWSCHETLADAMNKYSGGYIKLMKDVDSVQIDRNMTIDLNGFNMTNVEVADDCTLYGMDSQTDDYVIEGSKGNYSGFGKIANKTGDGTVAAVPVEDACAEDGYLMVSDNADNKNQNISFHRVKLQVYKMTLRSIVNNEAQPSIYYQSYFKGDQIVAQEVDNFGVALGVYEMPNAVNMDTKCKYSKFTNFISGNDGNESGTSTLLKGIMKETNSESINKRNANMDIYGRAYVKLKDGSYLFGKGVSRSLKEQIEETDKLWNKLSDEQMNGYKTVYRTYKSVMDKWEIPNIKKAFTPTT